MHPYILGPISKFSLENKYPYSGPPETRAMAGRRYPASEAGGNSREESPHFLGQGRRLRPRAAAGRSNLTPEARAVTGGSNPTPNTRGGCREGQPHVQGVVAVRAQEGLEEPSHIEGQEGQCKEIPLIQGKEQQLCFAGAAVKRYPTPKVRETQVRW